MPIKEIARISALSIGVGFGSVLVVYLLAYGLPQVLIA
jgi:hypothetical protein